MARKRILVAVSPEDAEYTREIIGPDFDYFFCHTLKLAEERLDENVALIVCGVHFAEGSMFELLRIAKANPLTAATPFIVVLKEGTNHSTAVINGIRSAAHLLGVNTFIDVSELRNSPSTSKTQAYEKLRERIRNLLMPP